MDLDRAGFSEIVTVRDIMLKTKNPCRLESGDPEFSMFPNTKHALIEAVRDDFTHYTDSAGILPLREAVVKKLKRDNKIKAAADEIIVTNGGMHALFCTFGAILNDGDFVLVPMPNWIGATNIIKVCGGEVVALQTMIDDGFMSLWGIWNEMKGAKAILLNTPHNPTGSVMSEYFLKQIIAFAKENDMWIISDEAYEHITYDGFKHVSPRSLLNYDKIISIFSFSKSYAMSGLRLGYIHTTNKDLYKNLKKAVLYTANGVNSVTQKAGINALSDTVYPKKMCELHQQKRDLLVAAIKESKHFDCSVPLGAFYVWVESDIKGVTSKFLRKEVGCIQGDCFGGAEDTFRFSYACPLEHIQRACEIIKEVDDAS